VDIPAEVTARGDIPNSNAVLFCINAVFSDFSCSGPALAPFGDEKK
jgi:hypothetical protein